MTLTREEIQRKILHFFSGLIIPGGILYIPVFVRESGLGITGLPLWVYPSAILALLSLALYVIEIVRFRVGWVQKLFTGLFGAMLRREESGQMTGATYMIIAGFICSVIFRHRPDISFMALSSFIWGDAAAALVGISIGRIRIGKKSLEGSAACFVLCCVMYYLLFPFIPLVYAPWGGFMPVHVALTASFCVTVLELFPMRLTKKFIVNDNLTVPVITGIVILVMNIYV
jgi:dolichol kinase